MADPIATSTGIKERRGGALQPTVWPTRSHLSSRTPAQKCTYIALRKPCRSICKSKMRAARRERKAAQRSAKYGSSLAPYPQRRVPYRVQPLDRRDQEERADVGGKSERRGEHHRRHDPEPRGVCERVPTTPKGNGNQNQVSRSKGGTNQHVVASVCIITQNPIHTSGSEQDGRDKPEAPHHPEHRRCCNRGNHPAHKGERRRKRGKEEKWRVARVVVTGGF